MMRYSKPISEVKQVVTIVEEDLDTVLDGFTVRSAGSASMGMAIPSDFNSLVETGQFQQRMNITSTKQHSSWNALDAPTSQRWPTQKYRHYLNFQSSFGSQSSASSGSDKSEYSFNGVYARRGSIEIHEDDCQDYDLDLTLSKFALSSSDSKTLTNSGF